MNFSNQDRHPAKQAAGIGVAVVFHIALVYGLINGLRVGGHVEAPPPEATFLAEPPKLQLPEPPKQFDVKFKEVTPHFVPPEEVPIDNPRNASAITDRTAQKPAGTDIVVVMNETRDVAPVRTAAIVDARSCDKPEYPARELREEVQGTTVLQFLIGADGKVMDSRIEKSSGSAALDKAAQRGLGRCAFKAGTVDGKPESSWAKIQYVWKLD